MSTNPDRLLDVLFALKANVMRDLHVAKLAVIEEFKNSKEIYCRLLNEGSLLLCYKLQGLELAIKDLVLIVFTDTDFRINYNRWANNQNAIEQKEERNLHSIDYGVIIGKVDLGEEL